MCHIALRATLPPLPHDPTTSELLKRRPYTILRRFPAPGQQPEDEEVPPFGPLHKQHLRSL